MLCVAGGDSNLETLKTLLKINCDTSKKDIFGNNLLHIAVLNGSTDLLEYLIKGKYCDVFERN